MTGRALVIGACATMLGGCFKPSFVDGFVECGPPDLCPPGYVCGFDGKCYREGHLPPGDDNASPGDLDGDSNRGDLVGGDIARGDVAGAQVVTVVPVYPTNADWNAYVKNDDPGADMQHQDDVACDAAADAGSPGPTNCVHGGERRMVTVTGHTDCPGYAIRDALRAWEWVCDDNGGFGPLDFFTVGFRTGRGLKDIVDVSGFLENAVWVTEPGGGLIAVSTPAVWGWSNGFAEVVDNPSGMPVALDVPSQIYVVPQTILTTGLNVDADRVALVTLPGASLTWGMTSTASCNAADGELAAATRRAVVCTGSQDFIWIEGVIDGNAPAAMWAEHNLYVFGARFARIHGLQTRFSDASSSVVLDATENTEISELLSSDSGRFGLYLLGSDFNLVRDSRIESAGASGVEIDENATSGSNRNTFEDIVVVDSANDGVHIDGGPSDSNTLVRVAVSGGQAGFRIQTDFNRLYDITAANAFGGTNAGLTFRGGAFNIVVGARFFNFEDWAWRACCEAAEVNGHNITVNVLAVSTDGHTLYAQDGADRATFSHVTVALSDSRRGFSVASASNVTANNLLSVNHDFNVAIGSAMPPAGFFKGINVAAANAQVTSVTLNSGSAGNVFTENLVVGTEAGRCDNVGGSEGLVDNTCTVTGADLSFDYTPWASDAVLHIDADATNSFVGRVTTDDVVNTSDTDGGAAHGQIADWLGFENPFRTWGKDGPSVADVSSAGLCQGSCRIWDWRLRSTDTEFLNFNCRDDGDCNFANNDPCPASVHGDRVQTDQTQWDWYAGINAIEDDPAVGGNDDGVCEAGEKCRNQFLIHATEITRDRIGDGDGLCESNEACIYSPNLGVYQGSGDYLTRRCTFTDGVVSGVTLYAYPVNGE